MLVLKRLIAFVVTGVTVIASGGAAWAGLGQPSPWELGLQQSATPVMDDIVWFHDFLLWLIAAIALFVLVLLAIVVVQVQRARQSGALAHHPQHHHRDHLDRGAGAHPGDDRGAVVPPAVLPTESSEGRPDREGHRQAVVLELQLSGLEDSNSIR